MIKTAVIPKDKLHRYQLLRLWDNSRPKYLFIMLNPSTADHKQDDPTIRRCIQYVKYWGGGGLLVGNLFSFRTPYPEDLLKACKSKDIDATGGLVNDLNLALMAEMSCKIIYAWGTKGSWFGRDKNIIDMFKDIPTYCLELSKDGHPKHPLYLRKNLTPIPFNVDNTKRTINN